MSWSLLWQKVWWRRQKYKQFTQSWRPSFLIPPQEKREKKSQQSPFSFSCHQISQSPSASTQVRSASTLTQWIHCPCSTWDDFPPVLGLIVAYLRTFLKQPSFLSSSSSHPHLSLFSVSLISSEKHTIPIQASSSLISVLNLFRSPFTLLAQTLSIIWYNSSLPPPLNLFFFNLACGTPCSPDFFPTHMAAIPQSPLLDPHTPTLKCCSCIVSHSLRWSHPFQWPSTHSIHGWLRHIYLQIEPLLWIFIHFLGCLMGISIWANPNWAPDPVSNPLTNTRVL